MKQTLMVSEVVEKRIMLIRGQKVMLSVHLAELYGVETRALNQAVKRNEDRFPTDFMFQLTEEDARYLVSQTVIPHRKYFGGTLPYAFTEQGVAMLSSVLNSKRAIQVNIAIMRAFLRLREVLASHKDVAHKLEEIERTQKVHGAHISAIWKAIQKLIEPPQKPKHPFGFKIDQ